MKSITFYLWTTIYKIVFEAVYILYISPVYSHMGAKYEPNLYYCTISYIIFFILIIIEPKNQDRPSHQLAQLLWLTTMVPILSIFWLTSQSLKYVIYLSLCFTVLFILLRIPKVIRVPLLKKETSFSPKVVNGVFVISIVFLLIFIARYGGIDKRTFSFETVYYLRSEKVYSGIWIYFLNWIGKVLIPLCIVIFFLEKKKILFIISCLMQLTLYLSTGHKTFILSVFLILGLTYILIKDRWKVGLPQLYSLMIAGAAIIYKLTDMLMIIAIMPLRLFIIPALISFSHYEFFSVNQKLHFSEGLIGRLFGIESPYQMSSKYIVSLSTYEGAANTGFLADAYANGGLIVMIMFMLIFALILLFVDSISMDSNNKLKYSAMMVYPIIILNDMAILTTIFTCGLGLLLVFMYILASEEKNFTRGVMVLKRK